MSKHHVRVSLDTARAAGESVAVGDLAATLLAVSEPVPPELARRIVATALDRPVDSVPDLLQGDDLRRGSAAALAATPLATGSFSVVDLETTGLSAAGDAIVEIGAVQVAGLSLGATFESLVQPPVPPSARITELTGIDARVLEGAPPPELVIPTFRDWLGRASSAAFFAHNARFDASFVDAAFQAQGLSAHGLPVLCTQRLARRLLPDLGRYNLDHLCAHFGVRNRSRHRALGDARATAVALVELLHIAIDERGLATLGELIDLQEAPIPRKKKKRRRPRSSASRPA